MKPRQQVSRAGIELIKRFEGYRARAAQLPGDGWTIGYGHTKTARAGVEVSEADAEALLIYDLLGVTKTLADVVYTPLTQNQFDALASFVFNIGRESFEASSVLKRLNEGAKLQAACAMDLWRKAEFEGEVIVIDALVRRRAAEKALFLTPPAGFIPAPSSLLRPQIDFDMSGTIPRQTPVEIIPSLSGDTVTAERVEAAPAQPLPRPVEDVAPPEPPAAQEPATKPVYERPVETRAEQNPAFVLTAPPEPTESAFTPPPDLTFEAANESSAEPGLFDSQSGPVSPFSQISDADRFDGFPASEIDEVEETGDGRRPMAFHIGLAILGLVIFGGGLFWIINGGGTSANMRFAIGGGLGLIGIVCTAFAVYFLLDRLGGDEEPDQQ
ncbi:MAG: glycoside hydrolase family protein [Caulobacteraceae bacterium]